MGRKSNAHKALRDGQVSCFVLRRRPPGAPSVQALQLVADEDRNRVTQLVGERFELRGVLGRGGMSQVYLAWERTLDRQVAIKLLDAVLSGSVEHRERFRREALIASRLGHPHIVPCYHSVHRPDLALAVMAYIPGRSLGELTAGGHALPWPDVLEVLIPIAGALAHAHDRGVIHRDVATQEPERRFLARRLEELRGR